MCGDATIVARMASETKHDLAEYERLKMLGRGSFGAAYLMRHKIDSHLSVLKVCCCRAAPACDTTRQHHAARATVAFFCRSVGQQKTPTLTMRQVYT